MNLFLKSQVKKTLEGKIKSEEIRDYQLTEKSLHIKKSKRCKYTIELDGLPGHILIRLLNKRIPDPGIMNTADFFKREIRDLKIKDIL